MVTGVGVASLTLAGGAAGLALQEVLRRRRYRVPEELPLSPRSTWWLVPVAALVTPLLWLSVSSGRPWLVAAVYVVALWVLLALVAVDLDVHRLPDAVQLPAYPVLALLLTGCSLLVGDWSTLGRAALAALVLFLGFLILVLLAPQGGMGFGDAKLAGLLGMLVGWLSWGSVVVMVLGTFVLGGVVALVLLAVGRAGRHDEFAYGPVLAFCFVAAVLARPALGV